MASRRRRLGLLAVIIVSLAIGAGGTYFGLHEYQLHSTRAVKLPANLPFAAYVPSGAWQTDQTATQYSNGILTLLIEQSGARVTLNQQATPEVFTDVPTYYPTLISKLNSYQSFGSVNGTVYLTHPTELHGQQQAVLNANGTLVFAHPSQDLTDDQWRSLFNGLQIVR